MTKILNWGMTPGMGDVMLAMNCAHRWSYENKQPLILNLHWFHGKDHLHHPEDPETIVERADYILGLYLKTDIQVNHIFNSDQHHLKETFKRYDWLDPRSDKHTNNWVFDKSVNLPVNENKVVIWRPIFNAEVPRLWKRRVENIYWDELIKFLKTIDYNVVELCYRTPIREATYHINTCNFIICYDGMWHYIAKNFLKPMIVSSQDGITKYHTRHCVSLGVKHFENLVNNLFTPIFYSKYYNGTFSFHDLAHEKSKKHRQKFWNRYNAN
jgi:hypothetical protein